MCGNKNSIAEERWYQIYYHPKKVRYTSWRNDSDNKQPKTNK